MGEVMAQIERVQTRDPVAGRKQKDAAIITGEFLAPMNASGLETTSEWRLALGAGAQHVSEATAPDQIQWTDALPKTGSGKIMRSLLRKILANDISDPGDTSTPLNAGVVESLIQVATHTGE